MNIRSKIRRYVISSTIVRVFNYTLLIGRRTHHKAHSTELIGLLDLPAAVFIAFDVFSLVYYVLRIYKIPSGSVRGGQGSAASNYQS